MVFVIATVLLAFRSVYIKPLEIQSARFSILPPEKTTLRSQLAPSPDGHSLAFVATSADGKDSLWVRSVDSLSARQLPELTMPNSPSGHPTAVSLDSSRKTS